MYRRREDRDKDKLIILNIIQDSITDKTNGIPPTPPGIHPSLKLKLTIKQHKLHFPGTKFENINYIFIPGTKFENRPKLGSQNYRCF